MADGGKDLGSEMDRSVVADCRCAGVDYSLNDGFVGPSCVRRIGELQWVSTWTCAELRKTHFRFGGESNVPAERG